MTLSAGLAACAAMVERGDPDRFAATMAAPPGARARLWPLYAFNLEVARAAYASDEPLVAEMRLQWWVDEIARLADGKGPQAEVAGALAPLLNDVPGLAGLLTGLIEARRWDCWREPFADRAALEHYLDATSGNLVWAAAAALGAPAAAERAVRDFAWGAGLANWLDAVPALRARGRHPLPDGSPEAFAELAYDGLARIARARAARSSVPAAARPAFWPGWAARAKLSQSARDPAAVARGLAEPSPLRRSAALILRSLTPYW